MGPSAGVGLDLRRRSMLSTLSPRSTASRTTAEPTNPQPPVTRTRIGPSLQSLTIAPRRVSEGLTTWGVKAASVARAGECVDYIVHPEHDLAVVQHGEIQADVSRSRFAREGQGGDVRRGKAERGGGGGGVGQVAFEQAARRAHVGGVLWII